MRKMEKLSKVKILAGGVSLALLMVLNFTKSDVLFAFNDAMASTSDGSSTGSSSTSNSCCSSGVIDTCIKRVDSKQATIHCKKETTDNNGNKTTIEYTVTGNIVMCPTDGECNVCQEYRPSC